MAMFHPDVFDRSDLLMFLEYYPWRSVFILALLGYCVHFVKKEFLDPYLVGQIPMVVKVVKNPMFALVLSFCIFPVMILLILIFDDYHDGF